MSEIKKPRYTRDRAVGLICRCYNHYGAFVEEDFLKKSILEEKLPEIPNVWNSGLFRFLDEMIYLSKIISYILFIKNIKDKKDTPKVIAWHQIEKNLLAIRVLCHAGLDGSARQNLRALYEMCHACCRCLVDQEFHDAFGEQKSPEDSNNFWHKFMARQKTEKFLQRYNKDAVEPCFLVVGDHFADMYKIMGVGAHPNFLGWSFDWRDDWSNPEGMHDMFHLSPRMASELVLVHSNQLAMATIAFVSQWLYRNAPSTTIFKDNPLFKHCSDDKEVSKFIGNSSLLMFMMLAKLINRNKPGFDPEEHF